MVGIIRTYNENGNTNVNSCSDNVDVHANNTAGFIHSGDIHIYNENGYNDNVDGCITTILCINNIFSYYT